jgi:hypothetical protein
VMTVEVENVVAARYTTVQMKARCIQTIEQGCLNSIEHIVTLINGYTCLHLPRL